MPISNGNVDGTPTVTMTLVITSGKPVYLRGSSQMAYKYLPYATTNMTTPEPGNILRILGVDFVVVKNEHANSYPTDASSLHYLATSGDIKPVTGAYNNEFTTTLAFTGTTTVEIAEATWTTIAGDGAFNYTAGVPLRYGTGSTWVYKTPTTSGALSGIDMFGLDPVPGQSKTVQKLVFASLFTSTIRPVKPRIIDLGPTSVALLNTAGVGTLREYIDAQDGKALQSTGGALTGALYLVGNAVASNEALTLGQAQALLSTEIGKLTDNAPEVLNVFSELAAAINNDPNAWTTLTTMIDGKAALSGATFTGDVLLPGGTTNPNGAVTKGDVDALFSALPAQKVFSAEFTVDGVNVSLSTTGVSAGTYTKLTVDSKGRVTAATQMTVGDVPIVTVDGSTYNYQDIANTTVRGAGVAARPAYRFDVVSTGSPISIPFSEADMPWAVSTNPARGTLTLDGIEQKPEVWSFGQNLDSATSAAKPYAIILNAEVTAGIEVAFRYLA